MMNKNLLDELVTGMALMTLGTVLGALKCGMDVLEKHPDIKEVKVIGPVHLTRKNKNK